MRLLFAGTPVPALPALAALLTAGHEVLAVATNPDAPSGRGHRLTPSPVAAEAVRLGLPLLQPARASEPWFVDAVEALAPDIAVVVAWGTLVPDALLGVPTYGWVNLHFSLLPAWRGAAPVQRAIMAGDWSTGITTFELVHDLDAGPYYRRQAVAIEPDETAGELLGRLADVGATALVATIADIATGTRPRPQPDGEVTLAPKVLSNDARIDWTRPARTIHDLVRAVTPAPGAWTTLGAERLKVGRTERLTAGPTSLPGDGVALAPGELLVTKRALLAGTGDGAIRLVAVQAPGKPMMDAADWARGVRLGHGARLGEAP